MTADSYPHERRTAAPATDDEIVVSTSIDDNAGISDLFSRLTSDLSQLFRDEVELAKVELRQEAKQAGKAGAKLAVAAVVGLIAALLLSWMLAFLLAEFLPTWVGFLIVGLVYAAVAAAVGLSGKKQLQQVEPTPQQTVETLKEDKEWVTNR